MRLKWRQYACVVNWDEQHYQQLDAAAAASRRQRGYICPPRPSIVYVNFPLTSCSTVTLPLRAPPLSHCVLHYQTRPTRREELPNPNAGRLLVSTRVPRAVRRGATEPRALRRWIGCDRGSARRAACGKRAAAHQPARTPTRSREPVGLLARLCFVHFVGITATGIGAHVPSLVTSATKRNAPTLPCTSIHCLLLQSCNAKSFPHPWL